MLTCEHDSDTARAVLAAVRLGHLPEALDLGLGLVAAHPRGDVCGCRFAADLMPLANIAELPSVAALLLDVVMGIEGLGTLTGRTKAVMTQGLLANARTAPRDLDEGDVEILGSPRFAPRHLRITVAEVTLRTGKGEPALSVVHELDKGLRGRRRRLKALRAAVGCGIALMGLDRADEGRTLLLAAIRALESVDRGVSALVESEQPPESSSLTAAANRWAWACAVVRAVESVADDWALERVAAAARYFASVGYGLGAVAANSLLAEIHSTAGDRAAAVRAAAAALSFTEHRFAVVADPSLAARWRLAAGKARDIGLMSSDDSSTAESFGRYESGCDWLGARQDIDVRMEKSVQAHRALCANPASGMRTTFENMIRRAVEVVAGAGQGEPLIRELVGMERADLDDGSSPIWLARALSDLAKHHVGCGDVPDAIVTAVESRDLYLSLPGHQGRAEADGVLTRHLDVLVNDGRWSGAVWMAAAFRDVAESGGRLDPFDIVRKRADHGSRPDVVEEVAAFTVERARTRCRTDEAGRAPLVRALCSWGVARDALRSAAGAPAFAEATALAEALVAENPVEHLDTLVRVRVEAAAHAQRVGHADRALATLDLGWNEVLVGGLSRLHDVEALIALVDATTATRATAGAKVDVLVPAGVNLVERLRATRRPPIARVRKLTQWASTLREVDASSAAAELLTEIVDLPGMPLEFQVEQLVDLAEVLRLVDNLPAARHRVDEALVLDQNSVYAHRVSGFVHLDDEQPDQARAAFERALELDGGRAWSHALRGLSQLRLGLLEESVEDLSKAVQLMPRQSWMALMLAKAHRRRGALDQALAVLSDAGAGTSDDSWLRYQFGLSLVRGSHRDADEFFRDALEQGSESVDSAGPHRRLGDPNLGLYMLASGQIQDAFAEFDRVAALGLARALIRDLCEDLAELATAMPDRAASAREFVQLISPDGRRH